MKALRRARGLASANLQGRKPRDVWRGGASDAMGISTLAVCCRGTLSPCLASDRGGDESGRPIATGRIGVAQRRSNDTTAIEGSARASMVVAGRELAEQTCST
jgi:hypothetical protein